MRVNFLVDNLGGTQLSYHLIHECNAAVRTGVASVVVFYNELNQHSLTPLFPTMHMVEVWGQLGVGIATSLNTANALISVPGCSPKFFYVWDLEWLREPQRMYGVISDLLTHEDLTLIARCKTHADVIQNSFNIEVKYTVEDFNMVEMIKCVKN